MRWQSFVVTMAVGIGMTVGGMVVINPDWATFYPWALLGLLANTFNKGEPILMKELMVSVIGGVLVALLGCGRSPAATCCSSSPAPGVHVHKETTAH
jgi:hypothetical protein